ARDIEVWRSRSMGPARVTRQRRQSRRIVWDDRAKMRAVVISELEAIQLVYVSLRMGRVSSIGPNIKMAAAVISELEVGQFAYVDRRIGRMRSIVGLRGRMKRIVGRLLQRVVVAVRGGVGFRIVDRVLAKVCLERLGGRTKRVVGRLLQRVVVAVGGGVGGFQIVDRVMIQVCLERLGGVVPAQVARPRR